MELGPREYTTRREESHTRTSSKRPESMASKISSSRVLSLADSMPDADNSGSKLSCDRLDA
jgi:hypothetical protein